MYKGDYIKSCQRDDKSPQIGAWFCSIDPFLYAQLWTYKNSPRHWLTVTNNVVDNGLLLIAPTAKPDHTV